MRILTAFAAALCLPILADRAAETATPVRFAIFGLTHDHAGGFIPRTRDRKDIQLAGIIEPRADLAARYARRFQLDTNLFFASLDELLAKTNYETTWYPGNQAAYALVHEQHALGDLRKLVVHDGHRGPKEIGCSDTFLEWLTDPVLNGGGALTDFGCYGADLVTWLMDGQRPTSVFAVTQQIKPDVYPKVEDEATIVVTYPKTQAILQASWNWPFDRKDMEVYGKTGYVLVPRPDLMRVRKPNSAETEVQPPPLSGPQADPLSYLAAVARGDMKPSGLSSLAVNLVVTEILDAARESARTGKRINL